MGRTTKEEFGEINENVKHAITVWAFTKNASQALEEAFPGKYKDKRDASRKIQTMMMNPLVREYYNSLMKEIEQKTNITKEWVIEQTVTLMNEAKQNADFSSSVKCLFLLSKLMGYMSKQVIDVKKTVNITFGGGFNPNYIDADVIAPNQLENNLPETINYSELPTIEGIQDENLGSDENKIDEF